MADQNAVNNSGVQFKNITLPASEWTPYTTNGATSETTVHGSNEVADFSFSSSTEEAVFIQFELPGDYDDSVLRWRVGWDAAATASGTAVFGLSGRAFFDSNALNLAFGTERTITDTLLSVGDYHITPNDATGVTLNGSPQAGKMALLKLVVKTSGTIAVNVLFLHLQLLYETKETGPTVFV